jgi:hypothetical protein
MLNRYKRFSWQNRRLSILFMLTSAFGQLAMSSKAFATLPGEGSIYTHEIAGGRPVISDGTLNEARQGSTLLRVWRDTNNEVTLSIGAEPPFHLGQTATYYAPAVAPLSNNMFMIVHTGTDNQIWYTTIYTNGIWPSQAWYSVPFQSTSAQVSIAQRGSGSDQVFMVYQGNPDQNVWGTLYNGTNWGIADQIGGGRSPSAPSITYNHLSIHEFWVAVRGETDNGVYLINGSPFNWGSWVSLGVFPTYLSPSIAAGENGNMVVSYINGNDRRPYYGIYDHFGIPLNRLFTGDSSNWQTNSTVDLQSVGGNIFSVLTGLNDNVYYKPVYDGGNP